MIDPSRRPTWLASDRLLARVVGRPVARFLAVESAGGILLLAATVVALVWANSPWQASYDDLWHTVVSVQFGGTTVSDDLRHWINDGLMAVFFLVVGLEIKRELVSGQLASRRDAALPIVAAIGGMVVPAALYLAINAGGAGSHGWGIPMATDIAFAVGVLALLGDRVPASLKVLILALAIVDDVGAIVVIAAFYSDGISAGWMALAVAGLLGVVLLRRARVWYPPVYVVVGVFVWFATLQSGVHATIAGVALGLLTPARPFLADIDADRIADELSADNDVDAADVRDISFRIRESVSVAERLEDALHPWTSYVVVPLFALANAGIPLSAEALGDAAGSRITIGVIVGLLVGKTVGVLGAATVAVRLGVAARPAGITTRHLAGLAVLAGIGFTVSIFITGLAFESEPLQDEAKIGVLVASVVAAIVGVLLLRGAGGQDAVAASDAAVDTTNSARSV
jgi:NhaA family Na+:H+ antiporter